MADNSTGGSGADGQILARCEALRSQMPTRTAQRHRCVLLRCVSTAETEDLIAYGFDCGLELLRVTPNLSAQSRTSYSSERLLRSRSRPSVLDLSSGMMVSLSKQWR